MSEINLLEQTGVVQDLNARTLSYWCTEDVVGIDQQIVDQLLRVSEMNGNCDARICLHPSPGSNFHEMIILQHLGRYYRPHKHLEKGEAFHIMEGQMGIFTFDDAGNVTESRALGSGEILRVGVNMFHAVMPLTDMVIYHENKPGPFLGDKDSIFPDWAPDGLDNEIAATYSAWLAKLL